MKKYALFLIPILLIVAFVSMANAGSEKKEFQGPFLKENSMKEQTDLTSSNENNTKSSEASGWLKNQVGSVIVGIIVAVIVSVAVIIAQIFFAPMIAKGVKREESILEQRYKVCEKAVNIMQRRLASVSLKGLNVPPEYKPTEKSPTQLEVNETYTLLSLYCTNASIANKFQEVIKCRGLTSEQVGNFIMQLRTEMQVKGQGLEAKEFGYIYGWNQK